MHKDGSFEKCSTFFFRFSTFEKILFLDMIYGKKIILISEKIIFRRLKNDSKSSIVLQDLAEIGHHIFGGLLVQTT